MASITWLLFTTVHSLYFKVAMKGRLWLEAYELHKATGKDIDHYLPHM